MIRVGRKIGNNNPHYNGYIVIPVVMKSHSKYWPLSPYYLKNEEGQIMENIWQFSKVYKEVPFSKERYSRFDNKIIWEHPSEIHVDELEELTEKYFNWRNKGFNNEYAVRYPVGYNFRHKTLYSFHNNEKLNYIESRKKLYFELYCDLVKKEKLFNELKEKLMKGYNLLIVDVDGPHQESLEYYIKNYNVNENFIDSDSIIINKENMKILLNDEKHPFGHGYCLAMALLEMTIDDL